MSNKNELGEEEVVHSDDERVLSDGMAAVGPVSGMRSGSSAMFRLFTIRRGVGGQPVAHSCSMLLAFIFSLLVGYQAIAGTITSNAVTNNWNAPASWVGGVVPGSGDDVVIVPGATITVTVSMGCLSLTFNGGSTAAVVNVNTGITLTVTNTVTVNAATTAAIINNMNVGPGTLSAGAISISGGTGIGAVSISTGTVNCTGNLSFSGTAANARLPFSGAGVLNIGGNLGSGGTFTASTSTVNFNGSSAQTFNNYVYSTVKVNNTAGVSPTAAVTITNVTIGDVTASSVFSDNGFQVTAAGTLTLTSGTFNLGSAGTATAFPGFATRNISAGTTVAYISGAVQTVSVVPSYANLTLSGVSKTIAAGTLTVSGDLTIGLGATYNGGTNNPALNLAGNFINNGTFTAGTGAVTLNGTGAQSIGGSSTSTLSKLTYANTTTSYTASTTCNISSTLTVNASATFVPSGGTITMSAVGWGITNNGTLTFSGLTIASTPTTQTAASFSVSAMLTVNSGITLAPTAGAITMTGVGWGITNSGTLTFRGLTIAGTPSTQPTANFSVAAVLTVNASTIFAPTAGTITMSAATSGITDNGTLTLNNLTIAATPTAQTQYNTSYFVVGTLTVNAGVTFAPTGGAITMTGTAWAITNNNVLTFSSLTIAGTPTTQPTANFSVSGTLTVNASTTLAPTAGTISMSGTGWGITNNGTLTFWGLTIVGTPPTQPSASFSMNATLTVNASQTFAPTGGTITMAGTAWAITNNNVLTFDSLTIAGTPSTQPSANFSVSGMLTVNASTTLAPTAGTITMSGTGWGITNSGTLTFRGLTIAGTPTTQPSASFSIAAVLTVNASTTFAPTAGTITMSAATSGITNNGTLTFNSLTISTTPTAQTQYNASYSVGGTLTVNSGITFAPSGGTITMTAAASGITNSGTLTFYNLTIATTPTAQTQYNASYSVAGALTVNPGVNFSPSGGTVTVSGATGSITNSGTLAFTSLTVSGAVSSSGNFSVGTTMTVSGTFTPAASDLISGAGTLTGTGTVRVTRTAATADFVSQYTITSLTLTNLTVDYNAAGQVLSNLTYGGLKVSGSITGAGNTASVGLAFTVTGTFTPTSGTITMSAAGSSISNSGTLTFYNLTIAATPTAQAQYNTSYSVAGTLTVNAAVTFAPTGGTITMTGTGWAITNNNALTFSGLTIAGTPTTQPTANFSVTGTLTVNASTTLAPTAGTISMSGTGWGITNNSTLTFWGLTIVGTPTTQPSASFSINATLTVNAAQTFAPTGGIIAMAGTGWAITNNNVLTFSGLTIAVTPTTQPSANFAVSGTLTVNSSTTLAPTAGTISMSGTTWGITNNGTLTFRGLTIAGTATTQPSASFSIAATLTVNASQTFAPSGGTITMSAVGWGITNNGTLTFNGLTIAVTPTTQTAASFSVSGMLTVNSGITLAPTAGAVTMTGVGWGITNSGTLTFRGLTIAGTPSTQPTANFSVAAVLTVNASTIFAPTAGTTTMSAVTSGITNSGTLTFNNLTIAATPTAQTQYNTSYSVGGTLTVNSGITFAPSGGTITMSVASSGITNNGTLTFYNLTIATTPTAQTQYNASYSVVGALTVNSSVTFAPSGGTVTLSGTGWGITNNSALTFNGLTIAGTPNTQPTANFSVAATLTVNGGTTFAPMAGTITMSAAGSGITNNGTLTFNNLTISTTPTAQTQYNANYSVAGTLAVGSGVTFAPSGGTITMTGAAGRISNSGTLVLGGLMVSATVAGSGNFSVAGTMTVNGIFTPAAAEIISGAGTLTGSGTVRVTRTLATADFLSQYTITNTTLTNLTVDYNGTGEVLSALTYGNLNVSGSISGAGNNATVNNAFSVTGTFTPTSGVITMNDGSTITNSGILTFSGLTVAASAAVSTSSNFGIAGMLTVSSGGNLSPSGGTITMSGTGWGITDNGSLVFQGLTIASTPTTQPSVGFLIAGGVTVNSSTTFAPTAGTITMAGTGWGITNNGTMTFSGLTIAGTPAVQSSANFSVAGGLTVNSGTILALTGGTVTITGGSISNSGTLTFSSLTVSGTATGSGGFSVNGTMAVNGMFTPAAADVISGAGTLTGSGTVEVTRTAATPDFSSQYALATATLSNLTVEYSGSGAVQTASSLTYGNLKITNAGGVNLGGVVAVNGTLTLTSGTFAVAGNTLTLNGPAIAGTPSNLSTTSLSNLSFGGASTGVAIPASVSALNNLTVNNSYGVLLNSNLTVNGTLTLTSGNLAVTDPNVLTMGASATNVGAGDVTGIVKRTSFVAGTSYTFGNQYTTINFQNVGTLPTDMSVKITIGSAPAWKTGAIKRTYELIQHGASGSFATINAHYLDGELNGNTEVDLVFWVDNPAAAPGQIIEFGRSNYDLTNNWVGISSIDASLFPSSFGQTVETLGDSKLANVTWNGSTSTEWINPLNWTPNGLPSDLADIVIPNASGTTYEPTLPIAALAVGRLTIQSGGILNAVATSTATISGASGAWSNNGGTFNSSTGTVIFTNAAATMSGVTDFYNVTINSGAALSLGSGGTMRIGGTVTNNGTWRAAQLANNTVEYNGGSQTVLNPNGATPGYDNLILSGTGTKTMPGTAMNISGNFTLAGTASATAGAALTVGGDITLGAGTTFNASTYTHNVAGNFTNNATFTPATSTVNFNGSSGTHSLNGGSSSFNNLTHSGTDSLHLVTSDLSVAGNLTNSGGTLDANGKNITVSGNWANSATFSPGSGTVTLNGSSPQTMSGSTFNNLTVNNAAGVSLLTNENVNGTLTVANGSLTTGADTVLLGSAGTLSESSGKSVVGNVRTTRTVLQSVNNSFGGLGVEINAAGAAPGSTTVTRQTGTQLSGMGGTKSIKRSFDITPSTNTGLNANLVYHYDNTELAGEDPTTLQLFKSTDNGSTWAYEAGSVDTTGHTISQTGFNGFSKWTGADGSNVLGNTPLPTTTSINPTSKTLDDAQFTLTVNGTNFVRGQSTVLFNGGNRTTTFVNETNLSATILASDLTSTGSFPITVFNAGGGGASNSQTFTVNKASPTVTLRSSLNPSIFEQSVTFTAHVTNASHTPTGSVTFYDGAASLASVSLTGDSARVSVSTLTGGSHTIKAVYGGDGNFRSDSTTLVQTVNQASPTVTLRSSLNPSTLEQSVTFTAHADNASSTPTGSVTFYNGAISLGTIAMAGDSALVSTSSLTVGSHTIKAVYSGDGNFKSDSTTLAQTVNQASSTVTLRSSLNPSSLEQSVTFTVHVDNARNTPTGSVTFYNGAISLGTIAMSGDSALVSTSSLTVGSHTIKAVYGGDGSFRSDSATLVQTVNKKPTTSLLTSSAATSFYEQPVTFRDSVVGSIPDGGKVLFKIDGTASGDSVAINGSGVAIKTISNITPGTHSVQAYYGGTNNFDTSRSNVVSQVVNKIATTGILSSALNPSNYGQAVMLADSVTGSPDSGTVQFKDGNNNLGSPDSINANGVAVLTLPLLNAGSHIITAFYSGTSSLISNTSNVLVQIVRKKPTSSVLTSSLNPLTFGQSATFRDTVSGSPVGGSVVFKDGDASLGPAVPIDSTGVATIAAPGLLRGTHLIRALYGGTSNFTGSVSDTVIQQVNPRPTSSVLAQSSSSSLTGDTVTFVDTVSSLAVPDGGTVQFKDNASNLGNPVAIDINGIAMMAVTALSPGLHTITAEYSGTNNYTPSTSNAVVHAISDSARYRSISAVNLTNQRDNLGKADKYVQRKPDKVYFNAWMVDDTIAADGMYMEFAVGIDVGRQFVIVPAPASAAASDGAMRKWSITFADSVRHGDTVKVYGWGVQNKLQAIARYYWKRGSARSSWDKTNARFSVNALQLPMPNNLNVLSEAFSYGGFVPTKGLLVGRNRSDSARYFGWVRLKNYSDVQKSLKDRSGVQSCTPRPFDFYTSGCNPQLNRPVIREQSTLPPSRQNNILLADMIAIKLNIVASALNITPVGFGELLYDDGTGNSLDGMTVGEIAAYGDSLMTGYLVDSTFLRAGRPATVKVRHFANPEAFIALDSVVAKVNGAFEGPMDTVKFGDTLRLTGVKRIGDVSYLHRDPRMLPARIVPVLGNDAYACESPVAYHVYQNFPNPFNPTTTIRFDLPEPAVVTVTIYNILGQEVSTLVDHQAMDDGTQEVQFDGERLASGVYFYRMIAEGMNGDRMKTSTYVTVKKMLLLK